MKKNKIILGVAALLALTACGGGTTSSPTTSIDPTSSDPTTSVPPIAPDEELLKHDPIEDFYTNGKIAGFQAPDPFVFRANGMYYLYVTTGGGKVKGYRSKDLLDWEDVRNQGGYVYDYATDPNPPSSLTPFAPEVLYHNGWYYMIASPSGNGHYVFKSRSPEGPYKSISDNIGHSIDGNYFIDSDHQLYMTYAGVGSINIAKMKDFNEIEKVNGKEAVIALSECRVGSWNEGGFILHKDGNYYTTFTGTHYLSSSYRVDYAYVPEGKSIFKSSSYENKGEVLLSTQVPTWRGLGHSSTVVGPDLDSYYIAYHNLDAGSARFLNLSRLSFNGSRMVANYVGIEDNIVPNRPLIEVWDDEELVEMGSHYILDYGTPETTSIEWNAVGDGEFVFDYVDGNNYKYFSVTEDLTLGITEVKDGQRKLIAEQALFDDIDLYALHTIRLGHKDGKVDVYYDGVLKWNDLDLELTGGKVGYSNNFDEYGYTCITDVAQGSSDKKAYNQDKILANAYDDDLSYLTGNSGLEKVEEGEYLDNDSYNLYLKEEGNRATYRVYAPLDNDYHLDIRVPASARGKTIGVRVDTGKIYEYKVDEEAPLLPNGDSFVRLADDMYLTSGQHYVSLYNVGDEFGFSQLDITGNQLNESLNLSFNNTLNTRDNCTVIGEYALKENRLEYTQQRGVGYVDKRYFDGDITVEATLGVDNFNDDGSVHVLFNAQEFSLDDKVDQANYDRPENFKGMRLRINDSRCYLEYIRFEEKDTIAQGKYDVPLGEDINVKIDVVGKTIYCYINGELVIEQTINLGTTYGAPGLIASQTDGYFKSLTVKPYEA